MTSILVVDDDPNHRNLVVVGCQSVFGDGVSVIEADSLAQARDLFEKHKSELALIVMDGSVDSKEVDTLPLIIDMRRAGFDRPIIAHSSSDEAMAWMLEPEVGASHKAEKGYVMDLIEKLLRHLAK